MPTPSTYLGFLLRFLFGERGPSDIVVTRSEQGTHFRLPNQQADREARSSVLVVVLALGALGIFLVINGTLRYAEEQRDYWGMSLSVAGIVAFLAFFFFRLRINWHYELFLTLTDLRVFYVASGQRWRTAQIDLAAVRQFTVLRNGPKSSVQAEAIGDEPRLVLRESPHEVALRLAELLAKERASFDRLAPVMRVTIETPTAGAAKDRLEPPLNSKVKVTQHEAGVTFDFPLLDDARPRARRRAWRSYEVGIFLLMAALVWYALCQLRAWHHFQVLAVFAFGAGILFLMAASSQSWMAWRDNGADEALRQLAVIGNLLIRTARDHRKQIWYRQEIRAVELEDRVETHENHGEGSGSTVVTYYVLDLVLRLHNGDKALLTTWTNAYPLSDYRPKAEVEWVATVLRQTLLADSHETPSAPDAAGANPVSSTAIREIIERANETRMTS